MDQRNTDNLEGNLDRRARRGIAALTIRQVVVQLLTFGGGVILARVLSPSQFGLFGIASFLVGAVAMFGDFGLAPSFIQGKGSPSQRDLQVGFTVQQVLIALVVAVLWLVGPMLVSIYPKAPHEAVWLVRTIAFSLFLTSWRSMSVLQMERALDYRRLAWIEAAEALAYQAIAVLLVLQGLGVWSLVWATLARGVLGTLAVFVLRPWRVRFAFDLRVAEKILRYGVPFQAAEILNSLGGWLAPILVGTLIGPAGVGFVTWAGSNGRKPLALVENVARVSFAHFSRLQEDWARVQATLVRYLTYLLIPSFLWGAMIWAAGYPVVRWVYTDKWLPAVPALMLYAGLLNLNVVDWLTGMTLDAVGLVGKAAKGQLLRTVITIGVGVPLVFAIGIDGVPIAQILGTAAMVVWMLGSLHPRVLSSTLRPLAWILMPGGCAGAIGFLVHLASSSAAVSALSSMAASAGTFALVGWACAPDWLRSSLRVRLGHVLARASGTQAAR